MSAVSLAAQLATLILVACAVYVMWREQNNANNYRESALERLEERLDVELLRLAKAGGLRRDRVVAVTDTLEHPESHQKHDDFSHGSHSEAGVG